MADQGGNHPIYNSSRKANQPYFGKIFEHEGATYHLDKTHTLKNGALHYYWQCSFYLPQCKARVVTSDGDNMPVVISTSGIHCHEVSNISAQAKRARLTINHLARETTLPATQVVEQVRSSIPIPIQALLAKKSSLQRSVRQIRQTEQNLPPEPRSLADIVIPDAFLTTISRCPLGGPDIESQFVIFDTGAESGDQRVLGFSTDSLLDFLKSTPHWLMDATFKIVPSIFTQLLVIHGQWGVTNQTLPCVYVLMKGKSQDLYTIVFRELRRVLDFCPDTVMADFEKSLHNALQEVFENVQITGCFFHLCQSIRKHVQDLGLTVSVREHLDQQTTVSMLRALPFIPEEDIIRGFEDLVGFVEDHCPVLLPLFDYFENTYIGPRGRNNRRRAPLFPPELWNLHSRVKESHPRTNNSVEGGHNRLKHFLNCSHPSFFTLLKCLQKFFRTLEADLVEVRIGNTIGNLDPKWWRMDQKKILALENYDPTKITDFLTYFSPFLNPISSMYAEV